VRNPAARTPAAVLQYRVGGPLVSPRMSGHLDISSWRAMLQCCPARTAAPFLGRTAHVEVAQRWGRARGARRLLSSCDPRGVEPSCPRFWRAGLSAPVPPPTWHELSVVTRQKGDDGAVQASSWVGRHGGEGVSGPLTVLAQCGLLPVL